MFLFKKNKHKKQVNPNVKATCINFEFYFK